MARESKEGQGESKEDGVRRGTRTSHREERGIERNKESSACIDNYPQFACNPYVLDFVTNCTGDCAHQKKDKLWEEKKVQILDKDKADKAGFKGVWGLGSWG